MNLRFTTLIIALITLSLVVGCSESNRSTHISEEQAEMSSNPDEENQNAVLPEIDEDRGSHTVTLYEEDGDGDIISISEYEEWSFEDYIASCNTLVIGTYLGKTVRQDADPPYIENQFQIEQVLKGTTSDEIINVFAYIGTAYTFVNGEEYCYEEDQVPYEEGKQYLLPLEKLESIMYDHDIYLPCADLLICLDGDSEYTIFSQPLEIQDQEKLIRYIEPLIPEQKPTEEMILTGDLVQDMMNSSEYVARVQVLSLEIEGKVHNGNTYQCVITDSYKGEVTDTYEDHSILLVITKDTVSVGQEYIVGFNQVDEKSLIYTQAIIGGVVPASDENMQSFEICKR